MAAPNRIVNPVEETVLSSGEQEMTNPALVGEFMTAVTTGVAENAVPKVTAFEVSFVASVTAPPLTETAPETEDGMGLLDE